MLLSVGVEGHSLSEDATQVEICLDQEGLRYLIERLSSLKKGGDHLHFLSPRWGGEELTRLPVQGEGVVASHHLHIALIEMGDLRHEKKEEDILLSVEVRGHSPSEDTTEVEIYLDQKSLQRIIPHFGFLKERGDHLHFFSPQWGGPWCGRILTGYAVRVGNAVAHQLRITLIEEKDMENKETA